MMMEMEYHNPVLLKETVDGLNIKPDGIYVDVTFGGGGHSKEILKRLGPNGKLFGFDQDEDAFANALPDERFVLIPENFRYIKRFLRFHGVKSVDGILADLGVSSHQFDISKIFRYQNKSFIWQSVRKSIFILIKSEEFSIWP